jgi:hypothetical protein
LTNDIPKYSTENVTSLIPGQNYLASAWVKLSSGQPGTALLYADDTTGGNACNSSVITPAAEWQQVSCLYTATGNQSTNIHLVENEGASPPIGMTLHSLPFPLSMAALKPALSAFPGTAISLVAVALLLSVPLPPAPEVTGLSKVRHQAWKPPTRPFTDSHRVKATSCRRGSGLAPAVREACSSIVWTQSVEPTAPVHPSRQPPLGNNLIASTPPHLAEPSSSFRPKTLARSLRIGMTRP